MERLLEPLVWTELCNIKVSLQEVGCEEMELLDLAQDRDRWQALVNAVMNIRFP
jgi:hypothetical protein